MRKFVIAAALIAASSAAAQAECVRWMQIGNQLRCVQHRTCIIRSNGSHYCVNSQNETPKPIVVASCYQVCDSSGNCRTVCEPDPGSLGGLGR